MFLRDIDGNKICPTVLDNDGDDILNTIENIKNINIFYMPAPSTTENNTKILQTYLDNSKSGDKITIIYFNKGEYLLNTCIIYSNTKIFLTSDTKIIHVPNYFYNPETSTNKKINILFFTAKPFDEEDSNIIGYNGRSNIVFEGGIIDAYNAFVFSHNTNIEIRKVKFVNIKSDHCIQIGGCKNIIIKDCEFEGMLDSAADRQYVEMIQIDWMTSGGQPYWVSTSAIFDSTTNDGILIDNCKFNQGIDDYAYLKTCIGSHSSDGENKNKNIIIRNCDFSQFQHCGLNIKRMENVVIDNNKFITNDICDAINIDNCNNVDITSSNRIYGGNRGIRCIQSNNIYVGEITFENIISNSDFILIGESENVIIDGVVFKNSSNLEYNILIRNSTDITAINCKDINCISNHDYFFRVYTKTEYMDNPKNDRICILNTMSDKKQVSLSSVERIIYDGDEILWNQDIATGDILLNDDINKFKDLKIFISFYGKECKDLIFISDTANLRQINIPDNTIDSESLLYVNEIKLRLTDQKIINISFNNKMIIKNSGVQYVESNAIIYKITGKRIMY